MRTLAIFSILALPYFTGCASNQRAIEPLPPVAVADRPSAAPVDVGVDWSWRIVGDAAVRPVQVFSMRGQTYLHMRDRRPVILLVNNEVVPFLTSWPYLVLQGTPDRVDVVFDGYRAVLERTQALRPSSAPPRPGATVERTKAE